MEPELTRPPAADTPATGTAPTSGLSTIQAVIFDMDGVLTDSEPLINAAAIAMFKEKGLQVLPEDFLPFVGTGEDMYLGGVASKYQFPLDLPSAKARVYELYLELVPDQLQCFPGARQLVERCRGEGLAVAVASSADRIKIAANLEKLGLPLPTWDAVVTGEEVKLKKPAPDIFLLAAKKLGRAAAECTVVEDAVNGVAAAKGAGMRCVAVAQTFPPAALKSADLIRTGIGDIAISDLINRQPGSSAPPALPPPLPKSASARPWGFWATVGLGLAIGAGWLLAQAAVAAVLAFWVAFSNHGRLPAQWETSGLLIGLATCFSAPVAVGLVCLFVKIRGAKVAQYLAFRPPAARQMTIWLLICAVMLALSDWLTSALGRPIVPDFMRHAYQTAGWLPLLWFAVVVAAPVAEETMFRGFLFEGLSRSKAGVLGAILLTALGWSAIHVQYDVYGIATIFVAGLLLGYVRWRSGSVFATMVLHALMNLVATIEAAWLA